MTVSNHLNLTPPLVQFGRVDELSLSGQTVSSSWSPSKNSLAVYATNIVRMLLLTPQIDFDSIPSYYRVLTLRDQITPKISQSILRVLILHLLQNGA